MAKITIPDKSDGQQLSASEFNQIKPSVNALYDTTDDLQGQIDNIETGGVSGLTPKGVLFGKSDGTLDQSSDFNFDGDTLALSIPQANVSTDTLEAMGDSLVQGFGISDPSKRFTRLVADALGLTESNHGVNGATMVGAPTADIPTKSATTKYLLIAFGVNDANQSGETSSDFNTAYMAYLNAAITKGWTGNQIILVSINGVALGHSDLTKQQAFNTLISNLATTFSATFVDVFTPLSDTASGGPKYLSADNLHVNDEGAKITANVILNKFNKPNFILSDQKLAIDGKSEIVDLLFKNLKFLPKGRVIVIDDLGNVGYSLNVPVQYMKGEYILDGSLIQSGLKLPPDFNVAKDIGLLSNAKIVSNTDALNQGASIILFTGAGKTEFRNYFSGGSITFYVTGGVEDAQVLGLEIQANGKPSIPLGIDVAVGKALLSANDANLFARLTIFTPQGITKYENTYSSGAYEWFCANGASDGTSARMVRINQKGQTKFEQNGDQTDYPSARVAINSTTEGFLTPRMTTTQRDAIVSPTEGLEIYNLTTHKKNFFNGTVWEQITSA